MGSKQGGEVCNSRSYCHVKVDTESAYWVNAELQSLHLKTEKTALAVFSDFSISPTLCPGFRDSLRAVCPAADSSYNQGLVRTEEREEGGAVAVTVAVSLCWDRRCMR